MSEAAPFEIEAPGVVALESSHKSSTVDETDQTIDWLDVFKDSAFNGEELLTMELPRRRYFVGEWFAEADLGFIYAARGVGKTLLSQALANHLSIGEGKLGEWTIKEAANVLYIDGEMPLKTIQERARGFGGLSPKIRYIHHQLVFERTNGDLNLADLEIQEALVHYIEKEDIEIVFLDNLSTLVQGLREDKADDWEVMARFLLRLRRRGVAVVIIAHSGKDATNLRGTSKKEDPASWVIRLVERDDPKMENGASFLSEFTKDRNAAGQGTEPLHWTFHREGDGRIRIECRLKDRLGVLVELVTEHGMETNKEIQERMQISKGQVSKIAKKGKRQSHTPVIAA